MRKSRGLAGVVLAVAWLVWPAPSAMAEDSDPPGRVARLEYSVGSVSLQPGGQGDWVQAVRNRPLTTGDNLWADKDSRAEVQIGSTSIRIDSETSITVLDLDDRTTQMRLSQGSLIVRVRHLDDEDDFEIDTPNSAFRVQRTGEYRVDVNAKGDETDTTVWHGRGLVTGGGSSYVVVAGQRAQFMGTDQLDHEIDQIPAQDDFDNWAFGRDHREDQAESSNYISPEMTGYEDLDEYGNWQYVADYGPVWVPAAVAPGWAPYRFGHWAWVYPWGWTWVADEPWGFAPFHYGRWAYAGGGWCWVPGPVVVRPVYAPALVVFIGGGGFGFGPGVAWFPLAPREVFVPWYRTSPTYVNNVNITNTRVNVTNITNVYNIYNTTNNTNINKINYANRNVANGVTAVSRDTFVNARPVATNLAKLDPKEISGAPVMRGTPAEPVKASVLGAGRPSSAKPPAVVMNRTVVATRTPPSPRKDPFGGRPASVTKVRTETPEEKPQPVSRAPVEPARPSESSPVNEAPTPRENEPASPEQPASRAEGTPNVPRPPVGEGGHPLVRQAPPAENRPEMERSEESKFRTWDQQRPKPQPEPRPAEPRAAEPSRGPRR